MNPVQINFLETGLNLCLSCSTSVHLDDGKSIIYIFPLDDSTDYQQKVKQIESPQAFYVNIAHRRRLRCHPQSNLLPKHFELTEHD